MAEHQLQYYCDRVKWLRQAAEQLSGSGRTFLTTYDRLLVDANTELFDLSRFLGLQSPLEQEYELQPRAGKSGVGDPSERILSGRILRQQREHEYDPPQEIRDRLLDEFESTMSTLADHCQCSQGTRTFVSEMGNHERTAN